MEAYVSEAQCLRAPVVLYRGERVNARSKNYLLLDDQRVRGIGKVRVQAVMSVLVMLASAISMAKLDKLEDVRRIVALAAWTRDQQPPS